MVNSPNHSRISLASVRISLHQSHQSICFFSCVYAQFKIRISSHQFASVRISPIMSLRTTQLIIGVSFTPLLKHSRFVGECFKPVSNKIPIFSSVDSEIQPPPNAPRAPTRTSEGRPGALRVPAGPVVQAGLHLREDIHI